MTKTKGKRLYMGLLACLFGLMLLMNALSPWAADDYFYAFNFKTWEKLTSVAEIFSSLQRHGEFMNGRYTPHFLLQMFTMQPLWLFDVCNSFVFVAMMAGMVRLVCGKRSYDWVMLCALTAAVFVLTPGFGPSFLWMAGSCNYLWCDVLFVWLLVPFADAILERGNTPRFFWRLLMIPAALFFGNMSQNVSASGVMLMVLAILWLAFNRKPVRLWMVLTTLAALTGWILCVTSRADQTYIAIGTSGLGRILANFQRAAEFMVEHGTTPAIVLLILIALRWFEGGERGNVSIAIGLLLTAMACNYVMAASTYYPSRAFTGSTLMLILGCAFALPKLHQPKIKTVLALCLSFVMTIMLLCDLPLLYENYAKYNDRQAQVAQAIANGEKNITTFGIQSKSRLDCFFEIHEMTIYPDAVSNEYYAKYYGLDSIVADRFE